MYCGFVYTNDQNVCSEFSFILKPSSIEGVGVFATHDIPAGTKILINNYVLRTLKVTEIPQAFVRYCIHINEKECLCPARFDRMEIDWYINHSDNPNIAVESSLDLDHALYCAVRDIKAGDEIFIDYNSLNEPEDLKEDFYKK